MRFWGYRRAIIFNYYEFVAINAPLTRLKLEQLGPFNKTLPTNMSGALIVRHAFLVTCLILSATDFSKNPMGPEWTSNMYM